MALQRIILEMGTGNDLYGEDYTKAATRAVQDALHHSSITLFRTMGIENNLVWAGETDVLIDILEKKGILTPQEAKEVLSEIHLVYSE